MATSRRRRDLARLALVVLVLAGALRLPAFFVDVFNSDETFLATQAQVIREGGNLYEEAADRKPPLVPYLYAGVFDLLDTTELWSIRMLAMLAAALTGWLVALEARRRYGRRAAWAAGLLCVFALVAFSPQDGQAANFEIFMLPAMTASVLLARRGRAVSAGVAVAFATLAKQTGAASLLPVLYLVWRARGRRGVSEALGGFGVPLALVALALGPGQLLYWTVLGNGSYVGVHTASTYVITAFLIMSLAWVACNLPIVWRLPVAWRDRRDRARDGLTDYDLWLWLLSAIVSVMIGLRFFGHYYLQLVPPLVLLTAGALSRGSRRIAIGTVVFAAVTAVGFSAAGYFLRPFDAEPDYQSVSKYLATHVAPDDRVLVWGSVPEIYWASGTRPATRFVTTTGFLGGGNPGRPAEDAAPEETSPEIWDLFYEDLAAHPPRYILDTAPAQIRGSQWTPINRFPRLESIVEQQYSYVTSIDGIAVYERDVG
ncbi:MAG: glycosyltransferase family 39 protein [Acidimicrobiia bacterium]|nr:glycosyltransferase family 39 protein [Acidimicrobiia bacterium]